MKTETKISFTLSELEAKVNDWCKQKAVITDDGEVHMQSQIEHAKILAFVRSLFVYTYETTVLRDQNGDPIKVSFPHSYSEEDILKFRRKAWDSGARFRLGLEATREELMPEQEEQFKAADMILAQNQKDCEQFKGRDGI